VFSVSWDLKGAIRLRMHDLTLRGFAVAPDGLFACRKRRAEPLGASYGPREGTPYGKLFFVDVPRRTAVRIDSVAECKAQRARLSSQY